MSTSVATKSMKFWIGIGISVCLVFWLIYSNKWSEVGAQLLHVRIWILLPAIVLFIAHFLLRAVRWQLLLGEKSVHADKRLWLLYDGMMVGNLATFILPLRIGEFVRPYMLSRCSSHSFATSFVSVILERFFDLSSVLLTFGILLFFLDQSHSVDPMVYKGAFLLSGVAVCIFLFIIASVYFPRQLVVVAKFFLAWLPKKLSFGIQNFLEEFLAGASVLKNGSLLLQVVVWSALVWGSCFLRFWISLSAFPTIEPTIILSVTAAVLVSLAIAAPSAPGFVGVYEAGCVAAFALFGLSKESATAYAIVTHLLEYLLVVFFGVLALFRNDLRFWDLLKRQ
jgi:uncharacterized protein (TIRG00374 family)